MIGDSSRCEVMFCSQIKKFTIQSAENNQKPRFVTSDRICFSIVTASKV